MRKPHARKTDDPEAPDPRFIDDGSPLTIHLGPDQTATWHEATHLADRYRANMHFHMQRISEISGNDVILYGHAKNILYHHRRNSAESGDK